METPDLASELIPHTSPQSRPRYQNWSQIDWAYHREQDVRNRRALKHHLKWTGTLNEYFLENIQIILALIVTGIACGFIAAYIDVVERWLTNIKTGVCTDAFWLPHSECCMSYIASNVKRCPRWKTWSEVFQLVNGSIAAAIVNQVGYNVLSILMGIASAYLVVCYSRFASGGGILELKMIASGTFIHGFLSLRTLVVKIVALSLSVASGMRIGKEGPFVHITACVGHVVSRLFPLYRRSDIKYRELIVACTGAGISVAFGAPIGGVVFSIEEITYFFSHHSLYQALVCCIVSALMLQRLDPTHTGKLTMFQVKYHHSWHWFEFFAFLVLGALGGILGSLVTFFNTKITHLRRSTWIRDHPILEVACILLLTGILNSTNEFLKIGSLEFLIETFHECKRYETSGICNKNELFAFFKLLQTAFTATFLTVVSYGCQVPCGIFVPSLFAGACLGRAMGVWMKVVQVTILPEGILPPECHRGYTCVHPAIYSIVGSLAVLAGTCRMTVSLVIIAFEMTGGIQYLVPCAIATMAAKAMGDWIGVKSIYEEQLKVVNYPFLDPGKTFNYEFNVKDIDVMRRPLIVLFATGEKVRDIYTKVQGCFHHGYPIVKSADDPTLIGYISHTHLFAALTSIETKGVTTGKQDVVVVFGDILSRGNNGNAFLVNAENKIVFDASQYCENSPIQVSPNTTITRLLHLFEALGLHHALIVHNAKLVGILTKKDLLKFIDDVEHNENRINGGAANGVDCE
ncbi:chloride channel ClC-3 [Perkinsela sp. CCAP 1560/4]|nr:chloride channel ClC-3 [Perkinsela sp. CCAP 1560/4]|eukprot:KNH04935.1 chloride channel ClC-3 [Perkinsela sp. CCAP 1560/4]